MQKIELLELVFARCGAKCGVADDDVLEVIIPFNSQCFFSGVVDCNWTLYDIACNLESLFDIDLGFEYDVAYDCLVHASDISGYYEEVEAVYQRAVELVDQQADEALASFAHRFTSTIADLSRLCCLDV